MRLPDFWSLMMLAVVFVGAMEVILAYNRPPPREDLVGSLAKNAAPTTPVTNYYFPHCLNFFINYNGETISDLIDENNQQ